MSNFRLYPGFKMSCFCACFCWDSRLSLREMDQIYKIVGKVGYGNSYLNSVFRYSKVFRLHAILHVAVGAVRLQTGKGLGYCYMIGRGPNCCLLGHVPGLLFCLYVKNFLPSIFNLIEFESVFLCFIYRAEKNEIEELGLFLMLLYKDFHFVFQRLLTLINRPHGTQVIYMELRGVVERWNMRSCSLSFAT